MPTSSSFRDVVVVIVVDDTNTSIYINTRTQMNDCVVSYFLAERETLNVIRDAHGTVTGRWAQAYRTQLVEKRNWTNKNKRSTENGRMRDYNIRVYRRSPVCMWNVYCIIYVCIVHCLCVCAREWMTNTTGSIQRIRRPVKSFWKLNMKMHSISSNVYIVHVNRTSISLFLLILHANVKFRFVRAVRCTDSALNYI